MIYHMVYSWGKIKGELKKKKKSELNKVKCKDLINLGGSVDGCLLYYLHVFLEILKSLKSLKSIIKGNNQ